jgi:AcrR family transcriptional regulator
MADSCANRGYGATTISDIVAGASVSRSTFYKFFQSKDECLLAAHDELSTRLLATIDTACATAAERPQATRAALRAALEMLASDLAGAQLLSTAVLCAGSAGIARHHALIDSIAARLDPDPGDRISPLAPDGAWGVVVIVSTAVSRSAALGDPDALLGLEEDFAELLDHSGS